MQCIYIYLQLARSEGVVNVIVADLEAILERLPNFAPEPAATRAAILGKDLDVLPSQRARASCFCTGVLPLVDRPRYVGCQCSERWLSQIAMYFTEAEDVYSVVFELSVAQESFE